MTRSNTKKTAESEPKPPEGQAEGAPEQNRSTVQVSRDEALKQSYAEATKTLREENLSRFNDLRQQIMKDLGYEWTPPPTAEEQAKATIDQLIADNPGLAEVYRKVEEDREEAQQGGTESL